MHYNERQLNPNIITNIKKKTIKENKFLKNLNTQTKSYSLKEEICLFNKYVQQFKVCDRLLKLTQG